MKAGFLIVDKPSGITSNDVVTAVRRVTGQKRVGHAGTLDPMATGVLVVAVGKVTRLIRYLQDQPKEYLAHATFGVATDTLDADGSVLSREPMDFDRDDLDAVLARFRGVVSQVPPMYSALKRDGQRLYELARRGEIVDREARSVVIHELEALSVGLGPYPEVALRVVCGKGTYVRSLVDDIAGALGGSAHLTALRRERIGSLRVADAIEMDRLAEWETRMLTPAEALIDLPAVTVETETAEAVRHGVPFLGGELTGAAPDRPFRVLCTDGDLLAVYRMKGAQARPEVVLPR